MFANLTSVCQSITIMHKHLTISILLALMLLSSGSIAAKINDNKYHDYREKYIAVELLKMQQFHLQQAQIKLDNKLPAHAWGDLAYLLCHIPNHHAVLQQMQSLAVELNKQEEMLKFYDKATKAFPNDPKAHALYGLYLAKMGDSPNATQHIEIALDLDPGIMD